MGKTRSGSPTIADVARECGVGTMTVSRVINGGELVSSETAARVRDAIRKLGYEPNEAARILKGQSSRMIGLIVPDLADPFFAVCAHAVQSMAVRQGYMPLLLASERDRESESRELAMLKSRNVAGVLIVPSSQSCVAQLKEFRDRGVPVVMFDRTFPGVDAQHVMVDNQQGAERAVIHLLDHGHRDIFCVGYDRQFNSISERIVGYQRAMKQAGLKPSFILADQVDGIGDRVVRRLHASKRPVAVFTLNNVMSMNLLQRLQREGIRVPEDVALIGFDDFELASLLAVPLTAVRQPAEELGRSATRLLLDWIHSGARSREALSEQIVLPTELVIRRSCGCDPPKSVRLEGRGRRMLSETPTGANLDNFAYSPLAT